jgi:autoinducer 2-degrading protein
MTMGYVLQVDLRIKRDKVDAFMKKLLENAAHARTEPGCRHFDVLVDPADATRAMLYEIYDDEAAFDAHRQTEHFKLYAAEAVPLLESRERHVWQLANGQE